MSPEIQILDDENSNDNYITAIFLTNINDPEIADNVKKMKAQCEVERIETESQRLAGAETTNMLKQMMSIHHLGEQQRDNLGGRYHLQSMLEQQRQ